MKHRLEIYCAVMLVLSLMLAGCGGGGGPSYKTITNPALVNLLVDGSSAEGFTGIASHIDTKALFAGIPVIPGELSLDSATLLLINTNVNNYLDVTAVPVFDSGSTPYSAGVTVDSALKKISVTSGAITVTWTFAPNSVTRTYSSPEKTSTYVYRTVAGQTSVSFDEKVNQSGLVASYKGTATYQRNTVDNGVTKIISATFDQSRTETNVDGKTFTVNGIVSMGAEDSRPGNLSFSGGYSVYLPSYGQVSGGVKADNMTYLNGYNSGDNTYYNSNLTDATAITFSSTGDYTGTAPVTNPAWLLGIWSGTFSDAPASSGSMTLSVTSTAYSWWGASADGARFYGTTIKYNSDNSIEFRDSAVLWGSGKKISATEISGTWTLNGRSGTFTLTKP